MSSSHLDSTISKGAAYVAIFAYLHFCMPMVLNAN